MLSAIGNCQTISSQGIGQIGWSPLIMDASFDIATTTPRASFLCLIPQNPDPLTIRSDEFTACARSTGLDSLMKTDAYFAESAAVLIMGVSAKEGTAPELLAVQWMNESHFDPRPPPNFNRAYGGPVKAGIDVGPFQVNMKWSNIAASRGMSLDGLGDYAGASAGEGIPFSGDPFENGRLMGRMFNFHGKGEDAMAAVAGKAHASNRRQSYRDWAPSFAKFFECLKRNPLWGKH